MTDLHYSQIDAQILAALSIPPAIIGRPPLACPACGRTWRGFDGDHWSVCCGANHTEVVRAHDANQSERPLLCAHVWTFVLNGAEPVAVVCVRCDERRDLRAPASGLTGGSRPEPEPATAPSDQRLGP